MPKLIFVYNTDSGLINSAFDFAHKIFRPSTYSCSLCKVTYGVVGKHKKWKVFLDSVPVKKEFYHRDEFRKKHPDHSETELPAIFIVSKDEVPRQIIKAKQIDKLNLNELIEEVKSHIVVRKVNIRMDDGRRK